MVLDVVRQYHGDSIYLEAFLASSLLVFAIGRRQGDDTGKKLLTALGLTVLLIFNDLAYHFVGSLTDATTYYRFFWMFPVLFVSAYVLTQALASRERKIQVIAVAAFCLCLVVGGNTFFNQDTIHRIENLYGLDQNTIQVCDAIMADWEETAKGTAADKEETAKENTAECEGTAEVGPVVAFDSYLQYQARAYEPRIYWGLSRKAYIYQAKHGYDYDKEDGKYRSQQRVIAAVQDGIQENAAKLRRCIDRLGIRYAVIRSELHMDDYLSGAGLTPITYSEDYTVYRVTSNGKED